MIEARRKLPNANKVREFVCDWCGGSKIITELEWKSYRFSGFPKCCRDGSMRRVPA